MKMRFIQILWILVLAGNGFTFARAAEVSIPNTFSAGTPAVAAEVNANFDAVAVGVNDNDSRIAALEASLIALQARVVDLENELAVVTANSVLELNGYLQYREDGNGYPTAYFSGINVQVVNGINQTTANGVGNLIVGYNQPRVSLADSYKVCSDGQYADQAACEGAGEVWALDHKSGSHNIVAGDRNSYSRTGGVVFGFRNAVNRENASITGGIGNTARGLHSSIAGGASNIAAGSSTSVSGGSYNTAEGNFSSVSGGNSNVASGQDSSISGGGGNDANGRGSSITGGSNNVASGQYSSISGGEFNSAGAIHSSISGGRSNFAYGEYSSVSGGENRFASGITDWAAGNLWEDF